MPKPPVTDLERELAAVFGVERLGQAEEGPEADQRRKAGHEHEDRLPRAGEQQYLADAGAMMGMAMKTMKISDMTSAMSRPGEAVADDGGRDHAGCRGAEALRQAESEEDCEIRREGRGEGADDIDAQPEQQRDAAAEAVGGSGPKTSCARPKPSM